MQYAGYLARAEHTKRRYAQYTLIITVITLAAVVISGFIQRQQLLDCTTPGGACYERNAQRAQDAVDFLDTNHDETIQELHQLKRLVRDLRQEIQDG